MNIEASETALKKPSKELIKLLIDRYFPRKPVEDFLNSEGEMVGYDDLPWLIGSKPFRIRFEQEQRKLAAFWKGKQILISPEVVAVKTMPLAILELETDLAIYSPQNPGIFKNIRLEEIEKTKRTLPVLRSYIEVAWKR
jgi:hypothetical protein